MIKTGTLALAALLLFGIAPAAHAEIDWSTPSASGTDVGITADDDPPGAPGGGNSGGGTTCDHSPEAPTFLLGALGIAGAGIGMRARRSIKNRLA